MNNRQVDLLNRLIQENEPVTGKVLAQQYLVSTKTIYNDISVINQYLKAFSSEIKKKPSMGIYIEIDDKYKEQLKKTFQTSQKTNKQNEEYKLLSTFMLKNEIDILDCSIENFTSESTIRREIHELEKEINKNGIKLIKHQGKISLDGLEDNIRKFFRNKLLSGLIHFNLTGLSNYGCINQNRVQEIIQIMNQLLEKYKFSVCYEYRHYLLMDLVIFDIRWKHGYFIEQQNDLDSNNPKIIETYLLARDLLNEVSGKEVAEKEIISLSQSLITIGNYENTYLESNAQIEKTVDEFIALVGELAGIHFEQDDYLRGMLINHIPAMIMRLRNKIHLKSDLMEEIKYQYGVLYNFVWLSGKVFKNNFNVELTDNEAALLTIHLEISVEKIKKPMNIYVICPHSLATSELLLNQVRKITGQYEHIHKVEYSKASSLDISINDLVISSVELKNVSFPYIHVGTIMKEDDLLKIQRKFLANTMEQTQYNFLTKNDEEYTNRLIKKLLGKSVYIREKVSSVEKCLSKIIQLADEKNLENIKFEKTIRHRENLGITSTYTGIALPHANPKEVQTSELIMMTLEKPIYWGQNLVKVVMLIAIAEKELEFYKDALKVIYSKIDSSSYIQNLWKSEDYESFMTALFSEANFESIL